jgi:hypothetical protein
MDAGNAVLLIAIVLIVLLITYAIWRNHRVKTSVGVGPININLDTERVKEHPRHRPSATARTELPVTPPAARISLGNVRLSEVTNEGAGGDAEIKAGDVTRSRIINTAGAATDVTRNEGSEA